MGRRGGSLQHMLQKIIKRSGKSMSAFDDDFSVFDHHIMVLLVGLCSPLVLIFIIHFTGNSEVIEEMGKTLVIAMLFSRIDGIKRFYYAGLYAFLFTISESIFYLNTILQIGNIDLFCERIILTAPMHILTTLIIVMFSFGNKKKIVIGFVLALILHLSFNQGIELYF